VLPVARGAIDPRLILGDGDVPDLPLAESANDQQGDHHDHAHVAMASLVVRHPGPWQREILEQRLRSLLENQPVIRLKGRLRQPDRSLTLQIQAVGSRLECWYEGRADSERARDGLELVVLAAAGDRERLERALANL
jgi:cobalamin biosynthesis protein CobW